MLMDSFQIREVLEGIGVMVRNTHVRLSSGHHSDTYIDKDVLFPHTWQTARLCYIFAELFAGIGIDTVIGPTNGGTILSQYTARNLSQVDQREVCSVYAEKKGHGKFRIRPSYRRFIFRKNVLVVDDILTGGTSVRGVVDAVRAMDGYVLGVGVIWNRGNVTSKSIGEVPIFQSLITELFPDWKPSSCPLCKKGMPISKDFGKGKDVIR